MRNSFAVNLFVIVLLASLSGCSVVQGIFEFGFWAGILVVVLVIALIIWVVYKIKK